MKENYSTERLKLSLLGLGEATFILELVNTPGWLRFIGDRNIKTEADAKAYIQRITDNPTIQYWVVRAKEHNEPMGLVTLIKRDYLAHHDIGFAFLERYNKKGYAYEATAAVLADLATSQEHSHILATTIEDNVNSIRLLEKLGLQYDKKIQNENNHLLVYAATTQELLLKHTSTSAVI